MTTTQTFRAPTAMAAFERIRLRLGDSAAILEVRETPSGVEVVASAGRSRVGRALLAPTIAKPRAVPDDSGEHPVASIPEFGPPPGEVAPDGRPVLRVVGGRRAASPVEDFFRSLDFPIDVAARIGSVAGKGPHAWNRVLGWLERTRPILDVPAPPAGSPLCVGFVGPRGVGRSTIARGLAASAAMSHPGRVIWVEVGFPGRRLAQRHDLDVPLGVDRRTADSPQELRQIGRDYDDVGLVVVDLPGVDVAKAAELNALERYVTTAHRSFRGISWHVVVPANWSVRESCRAIEALKVTRPHGVAWTFLDAVADPGTTIATALRTDLSPSFFHGDRTGDGATSRGASWEEVVDWLQLVSLPRPTDEPATKSSTEESR
jgi:hypothetical protein